MELFPLSIFYLLYILAKSSQRLAKLDAFTLETYGGDKGAGW